MRENREMVNLLLNRQDLDVNIPSIQIQYFNKILKILIIYIILK